LSPVDSFVLKRLEFSELGGRNSSRYVNCSRGPGLATGYTLLVGSLLLKAASIKLTVSNISRRL